jgi:uncharacterized protein DUF3433
MTPGVDESPIIHFALDQLTRDVDVRGSRSYPTPSAAPRTEAPATAGAVESPGYTPSPDQQKHSVLPVVAGASAVAGTAAIADERVRRSHRESRDPTRYQPIVAAGDDRQVSKDRITPGPASSSAPRPRFSAEDKEVRVQTPPQRHPLQESVPSHSSLSITPYEVFVPYSPSLDDENYPSLTFVPAILRPLWMALFILLCILMFTALTISAIWSVEHSSLWAYKHFGDGRYFLFEYLPTLLGMAILLWLFQIQIALQRIAPYMAMAAHSTISRSAAAFLPLYPSQFLLPNLHYFRAREFVIGGFMLISWLFLFTIPLLSSCYNVRWIGDPSTGSWQWLAVQGVIWTTVILYLMLILASIGLVIYLHNQRTGLKWDPRSLADIMALLERSNIMADYADSETFSRRNQFTKRLWSRTDRLGYWHTSRRPQDIFYGLGEEGGATRRYSLEQGRIKEKQFSPFRRGPHGSTDELNPETEDSRFAGSTHARFDLRNPEVWHRYVPWQLTTTARLAFMLFAIILLIAFFVVTFLKRATLSGFIPKLTAQSNPAGFSPANFLYSFLPSSLGLIAFLLWQPLDFTHRSLAPFVALSAPEGARPEDSLLLDLPFTTPLVTTRKALSHGNLTVAVTSALALVNAVLPVLAGGVFWAQWYPSSEVRVAAQPAGLYALCAFLVIYALGYVFLFVHGRAVSLPHPATCLAEIISWMYMSPLLTDRAFSRPASRADMIARLGAPVLGQHRVATPATPAVQSEKAAMKEGENEKRYSSPPRLTVRLIGDEGYGSTTSLAHEQDHNIPVRGHTPPPTLSQSLAIPLDTPTPGRVATPGSLRDRHPVGSEQSIEPMPPINATKPLEVVHEMDREVVDARYGFGVFVGRDGREHLGIERVVRGGRGMDMGYGRAGWV